jgi:putative FmdB family regulatory protein
MPIYEYRCDNAHTFEVMQRMTDDPVRQCEQCGAPVQRVFHPVAVHFKGSGFYNTDYGKKKKGAAATASEGGDAGGGSPDKSSDSSGGSSDAKPSDSASSSAASSSSASSD